MEPINEAAHALPVGESKMPQIDISTFPMQIFWLVVVFALLYVVLAGFVLPKFGRKLARRQDKINEDILAAKRFENQAESLQAASDQRLAATRDHSRNRMREAHDKALHSLTTRKNEVEAELRHQTEQASARLHQAKAKVLSELPQEINSLVVLTVRHLTGEEPTSHQVSEIVTAMLAADAAQKLDQRSK